MCEFPHVCTLTHKGSQGDEERREALRREQLHKHEASERRDLLLLTQRLSRPSACVVLTPESTCTGILLCRQPRRGRSAGGSVEVRPGRHVHCPGLSTCGFIVGIIRF